MEIHDLNHRHDSFVAKKYDNVVMINFKDNPMLRLTDLNAKEALFSYIDSLAGNDDIKTLVCVGSPEKKNRQVYLDFFQSLKAGKLDRHDLLRMYNAVNQLILKLVDLNKAVIHADSGEVTMMFLNISLACDYRIITDTTIFQNPCLELGMVPKGGGAFFLSKRLGTDKAFEILLSCRDITAKEALEMGLVNQVVPEDDLEEAALETAYRFSQNPASSLFGVKRLINYNLKDLREYLEFETQEIMKIVDSSDFGPNL